MSRLANAWHTWVSLWDLREHPRSMALVRMALGLVMLWDLAQVARLGLVVPLLGTEGAGGASVTLSSPNPSLWSQLAPDSAGGAWALWGLLTASTALYTAGLWTRPAILAFVLLSAQWEWQLPAASRGIESQIRIVLLILMFSGCDRWLAVAAWRRTGSVWGDGAPVPAWPRHLVIVQLILMYFLAGVQKFGLAWSPAQGFSALYLILQDPAIANARYDWLATMPWYALTQIGTAATMAWEWTTPSLLLVYWYRFTADRPGVLRRFSNRWRLERWWAAVGVAFHLGIALTMELGIFPWAMVACYACFLHPNDLDRRR